MNYNLNSILKELSSIHFNEIEGGFSVRELWEWMVFDHENSELNKGLEIHEPSGVPIRGRIVHLDETLMITGDYFCFTYVDHQPLYHFQKVESLDRLANLVLSKSGINNSFTSVMATIVKGEIQSFDKKTSSTQCELDLIFETQQLVNELSASNFDELAKQGRECLIRYKDKGLSQLDTYNAIHYISKIYQSLFLDYKADFLDERLDYISGYIGDESMWVWEERL